MIVCKHMNNKTKKYLSDKGKEYLNVQELADLLQISRVGVFKKIKNGQLKAKRIGRNYVFPKTEISEIIGKELSEKIKKEIDRGVEKVLKDYGTTIKMLGKE